jgi:hypothetical protein
MGEVGCHYVFDCCHRRDDFIYLWRVSRKYPPFRLGFGDGSGWSRGGRVIGGLGGVERRSQNN